MYSHGEYQNVKLRKTRKFKLIDIVCYIVEVSLDILGILCKKETGRNIDMEKMYINVIRLGTYFIKLCMFILCYQIRIQNIEHTVSNMKEL